MVTLVLIHFSLGHMDPWSLQSWVRASIVQHAVFEPVSGVTRLQCIPKGPFLPQKTASGKFWAPHSAGPACTARLARPIVTPLEPVLQ